MRCNFRRPVPPSVCVLLVLPFSIARGGATIDPSIPAPSNLTAEVVDDAYGGWKNLVISWYWDTANYHPAWGGSRVEARDDTAGTPVSWMLASGSEYQQSLTRGIAIYPQYYTPASFIHGHAYTLRVLAEGRIDSYGNLLTQSAWSGESTITLPLWEPPKPPDEPTFDLSAPSDDPSVTSMVDVTGSYSGVSPQGGVRRYDFEVEPALPDEVVSFTFLFADLGDQTTGGEVRFPFGGRVLYLPVR